MPTKTELSAEINAKLPGDAQLDLTSLPKDTLVKLNNRLDALFEQIVEGGEELLDDLVAKRVAKRNQKRFGLDNEETGVVQKMVKKRLENGPLLKLAKGYFKKKILEE